jgi:hypothetical protein
LQALLRSRVIGHSLDCKGMNPVLELFRQYQVNHAMSFKAGFAGKYPRDDADAKMAFAIRAGASMTGMMAAFIRHLQF